MRSRRIVSVGIALSAVWAAAVVVGGATGRASGDAGADVGNIKWKPGPVVVRADSGADVTPEQVSNIKW